ncbi:MAG: nucleotidyl transferase AbiEii/AbiGii toxin family protein [Patescibacteria group bacterium]
MAIDLLTPRQKAFLEAAGKDDFVCENFYLTGGTALAALYLGHRYSEDLDFFSEKEIDVLALDVFLRKLQAPLSVKKFDFQQSYNRNLVFLEYEDDEILKTEFTFFPFPRIEKGRREYGIETDSLPDIAINKLFTIYQRVKARDYIDLYLICRDKNFTIADLIPKARAKFDWHIDPLQLGTQFLKAREAADLPRMIAPITNEEWRSFFVDEAKKMKQEVLDAFS